MNMFSAEREETEQVSSDFAMSLVCFKYGVLSIFYLEYLIGFSKFCTSNFEDGNIPLEMSEWGSVCLDWSKYSYLVTLVASHAEFHYYFGNSGKKTQQPNLSSLSLLGDFRTPLPGVCTPVSTCIEKNQTRLMAWV